MLLVKTDGFDSLSTIIVDKLGEKSLEPRDYRLLVHFNQDDQMLPVYFHQHAYN